MESSILKEDYQMIAASNLPFEKYKNCTFLITGATGLIGSLVIKSLLYINSVRDLNLHIVAVIRNREKAEKIFAEELSEEKLEFWMQDLTQPFVNAPESVDYIIHAGANTTSKDMVQYPVDNLKISVNGTMSVLDLARQNAVRGMVYLSSMEVYGQMNIQDHMISEQEMGYIDLSSARSCYPEGKRICECMCNAYSIQYGVQVCTARLAQTFGAGILKSENRVFAQFARSAIHNENIVLHTAGLSEGNYVYTADAIRAILLLLTEGKPGEAYNVCNEDSHMTIREMAELVANEISAGKIHVVYDIPANLQSLGYAADVKMHLSSEKIKKLGWHAQISLKESYTRMIGYMRESKE